MFDLDIDDKQLQQIADDFGATEKQVNAAMARALSRTATTLRKIAATEIKNEIQARTVARVRKRIALFKMSRGGVKGIKLWAGLNDFLISDLKGSPRQTKTGARFRGDEFDGAFVSKMSSKPRGIFKRVEKSRLPIYEQGMPVSDEAERIIEREVFSQAIAILLKNFTNEIKARTAFDVGA